MSDSDIFITKKPNSEILRKHISFYYFHQYFEKDKVRKIVFYPNIINAVTIYKNSYLVFKHKNVSITKQSQVEEYNLFYAGIRKLIGIAEMETPFDKIGAVFEPLGIHHFTEKTYQEILPSKFDCVFTEFNADIFPILDKVYHTFDLDERVRILDEYFLSKLNDFEEKTVEKAIELVAKNNQKFKVSELAEELNISQKTLNRKFQKQLNCTVKDYLEIAQFRKSFNHFPNQNPSIKLTDLAYKFDYYDQSEFIRQFKKITGINPKKLFQNVENLGEEDIFWGK